MNTIRQSALLADTEQDRLDDAQRTGTTSMPPKAKKAQPQQTLESMLWDAANQLRGTMDAAEYKHVVLGLIFLKYISDVFDKQRDKLTALSEDPESDFYLPDESDRADLLEDRDEYTADGVFWVPEGARWDDLRKVAKQPDIGSRIDAAMDAIEKDNASLKGVLPKSYARRELDPAALGTLIDSFSRDDLAVAEHADLDVLGRVYEYFLGKFAAAEGKNSGEFYTPRSIVRLMVEMLEPFNGRVFDPACGSGGMFVQADRFVKAHGGVRDDISVFGQEYASTTWRLAKMNLALRGIESNLGPQWGDSFSDPKHPDLRADFVLANPPFGQNAVWAADRCPDGDPRFPYGKPPANCVNYAWLQLFLHHLAPTGTAATVMPNGSLSSQSNGEGEIRQKMIDADVVECIVSLPPQLFYGTQIPVCLWFMTKDKSDRKVKSERKQRARKGEMLFIDARKLGFLADRTHRELSDDDIARIAGTYHSWRGEDQADLYTDELGFCASVTIADVAKSNYVLTPGRYVGAEGVEGDGEPLEAKLDRLSDEIREGFLQRTALQVRVLAALDALTVNDDA